MSVETSAVTTVNCATAHTKGSWTQLIASTSVGVKEIIITLVNANVGSSRFLVDIGIGGAGAETVIIANLLYSPSSIGFGTPNIRIPIGIPAGSRISARCQSDVTAARSIGIKVWLVSGTSSAVVTTYGADTANTRGTVIDPGATINTKGSYAQIVASITAAIEYFVIRSSGLGNSAPQFAQFKVDLATGAGGAEAVLIPDMFIESLASGSPAPDYICLGWEFEQAIANGTRLAARAECTINDATDRLTDIIVYGVSGLPSTGGGEHSAVF